MGCPSLDFFYRRKIPFCFLHVALAEHFGFQVLNLMFADAYGFHSPVPPPSWPQLLWTSPRVTSTHWSSVSFLMSLPPWAFHSSLSGWTSSTPPAWLTPVIFQVWILVSFIGRGVLSFSPLHPVFCFSLSKLSSFFFYNLSYSLKWHIELGGFVFVSVYHWKLMSIGSLFIPNI